METAPRNCRFLSLVVVELVLNEATKRPYRKHPTSGGGACMWCALGSHGPGNISKKWLGEGASEQKASCTGARFGVGCTSGKEVLGGAKKLLANLCSLGPKTFCTLPKNILEDFPFWAISPLRGFPPLCALGRPTSLRATLCRWAAIVKIVLKVAKHW